MVTCEGRGAALGYMGWLGSLYCKVKALPRSQQAVPSSAHEGHKGDLGDGSWPKARHGAG